MGKAKKASKLHWKKINHLDVEEYLDDERVKERYNFFGKEDFFAVDKGKGVEAPKESEEPESDALVDFSKLRCFHLQKPHTNVQDPLIKRNTIKINSRVKVRKSRLDPKEEYTNLFDPWDPKNEAVKNKIDSEWFRDEVVRANNTIKKSRLTQKTTEIKAIEFPHPGFSVNPSFRDHQDLLRAALDVEQKEIKREEKLDRATRVPPTAVKEEDLKLENIDEIQVKSEPEDDSDDDKKPSISKMKTKKQRRKEQLSKKNKQTASELKQIKVRESDVFTIKKIKRDIEQAEKKQKAKLLHKVNKKIEATKFGQHALSKHKFSESKLNPLLSDEISGTLLGAKNNSNLILDRYKSFQKRNILEVRVKQRPKRQNKLKRYQRPSEKMEWEKTGVWNGIKL